MHPDRERWKAAQTGPSRLRRREYAHPGRAPGISPAHGGGLTITPGIPINVSPTPMMTPKVALIINGAKKPAH